VNYLELGTEQEGSITATTRVSAFLEINQTEVNYKTKQNQYIKNLIKANRIPNKHFKIGPSYVVELNSDGNPIKKVLFRSNYNAVVSYNQKTDKPYKETRYYADRVEVR